MTVPIVLTFLASLPLWVVLEWRIRMLEREVELLQAQITQLLRNMKGVPQ